jgi:predicted transposase YdaD
MSILQQEPAYQKRVKELQSEGEARGKAEGKAEGKLETAKKLLSAKFGKVSPEVETKLRSMTADDLDDLLIRSLEWTTSKSLFDYLGISISPN